MALLKYQPNTVWLTHFEMMKCVLLVVEKVDIYPHLEKVVLCPAGWWDLTERVGSHTADRPLGKFAFGAYIRIFTLEYLKMMIFALCFML